ncbi:MAG: SPOR domain-containing protein [Bacteroidales bacterium]|jgi:hypothetical protein|nr:SPOR domain-containing protein [Bacteroidales bacterium]
MKKFAQCISIALLTCMSAAAQSNIILDVQSKSSAHDGAIVLQQDPLVTQMVLDHIALNQADGGKTAGWRVQIHSSSNRNEAEAARAKFVQNFPDYPTYFIYQPPMFKIRVGDFRTREDAFMLYKQTVKLFNVSYVISDVIQYPKL